MQILNRWKDSVIFKCDAKTMRDTVEIAVVADADLTGADLIDANLTGADLTGAKNDFLHTLKRFTGEVPALREALVEGRINGSQYEGDCCCLVGTLAKAKGVAYYTCPHDASSPAERLFMAIKEGDTPDTNQVSRIVVEWIDEWTQRSERRS